MAWDTIDAYHFDLARTPDHVFSGITGIIYKLNTCGFHLSSPTFAAHDQSNI